MSRRRYIAIAITVVSGIFLFVLIGYAIDETGFGEIINPTTQETEREAKTLWDWMDLLLIPAILAIGGYLFSQAERRAEQEDRRQRDKTERDLAEDRRREDILQNYLGKMTELLIDKELRTSEREEPRNIARTLTLTALRRLDSERKTNIAQFLEEAELIDGDKPIISLSGADLSGVTLFGAWLSGADLVDADLSGADLRGTNLSMSILDGADLSVAKYNDATKWPDGFDPEKAEAIKVED